MASTHATTELLFFFAGLPPPSELVEALPMHLPSLMLFAITWSLGASCDKAGRPVFDSFVREKLASVMDEGKLHLADGAVMPATATVYDWCYDRQVCCW